MATFHAANDKLHLVFVYCCHDDQGGVAVITDDEWREINTTGDYYENIYKYVRKMCGCDDDEVGDGKDPLKYRCCKWSWYCCGGIEYNPQTVVLEGQETVKINFEREGGGWEFEYFKNELYTSKGKIDVYDLPKAVRDYLSHLDVPYPED